MRSKSTLVGVFLVTVLFLSCGTAAQQSGAGLNLTCPPVMINSIEILNDSLAEPGLQIFPAVPEKCIGILRCSSEPVADCMLQGGIAYCGFNASSADVGLDRGGYCLAPGNTPVLCNNSPVANCIGECSFHESGKWAGFMLGEYCYDRYDGYKGIDGSGIRKVAVKVNVSSPAGIKLICPKDTDSGSVKMKIDNYESKNKYSINLNPPNQCYNSTNASNLKSAIWTGEFFMHYWEMPGFYDIKVSASTCCGSSSHKNTNFEYLSSAQLCIAPNEVYIDYGSGSCDMNNLTSQGDMIMGSCNQSDLSSKEATLRNIGNTRVNALAKSTDLECVSPDCWNVIPATKLTPFKKIGNLYIDFGNGWNDLQNEFEKINLDPHCGCENYYGLPPGPHATNIINLMIKPMMCVKPGAYRQDLTITADIADEGDCQDNREQRYPQNDTCIEPPQCYEIPGRYPFGTNCSV